MATLTRLAEVPVSEIKWLGPKNSAPLAKAGIRTVADLLHHVPRTYIDRTNKPRLDRVVLDTEVTVIAEVKKINTRRPKKISITEATIADETATLKVIWFNQPYLQKRLPVGTEAAFSGTVTSRNGSLQMANPVVEMLGDDQESIVTGRIVPVHPQVGSVKPWAILRAMHIALNRSRPIPDPIPAEILERKGLISRDQAFSDIHFPESLDRVDPARNRLVYDEFFRLELVACPPEASSDGGCHRVCPHPEWGIGGPIHRRIAVCAHRCPGEGAGGDRPGPP